MRAARKEIDEQLASALHDCVLIDHLAKTTESFGLFISALSQGLHTGEHLPFLIERIEKEFAEPYDFESESSDSVYFNFAQPVLLQVECSEELCEKNPQRFHLLAREMPCWPFRVFRHRKAYAKRFDRLADRLKLGENCPIHSSNAAEYTFEKPINAFVFKVLTEFLRVHGFLNSREGQTIEESFKSAGISPARQAPFSCCPCACAINQGRRCQALGGKSYHSLFGGRVSGLEQRSCAKGVSGQSRR